MNIQIKNRFNESVIFEGEFETLKKAVEHVTALKADLSRADLSGADLSSANLSGADLSGADLSEASLYWADLSGANLSEADLYGANLSEADLSSANLSSANLSRADLSGANLSGANLKEKEHTIHSIRQISPIGSRDAVCIAFATNKGLWFRAGCFWGDIETFKQKVKESHGDNAHGEDYRAFISLCETWAKRFVDVSR